MHHGTNETSWRSASTCTGPGARVFPELNCVPSVGQRKGGRKLAARGYGAIGVRAAGKPTAGHLVGALLRAFKYPFRYGAGNTVYSKRNILFDLIEQKRTRVVCVDEAHRLLRQVKRIDDGEHEPPATQFLGDLMDECGVGLVLAGSPALDQLQTVDSHLADRTVGRHELGYFSSATSEWRGILKGFHKQCSTFDLEFILSPDEAQRLNKATAGSLRRLKCLLTEAVLIAVDAGKHALDADVMKLAFIAIHGRDSGRLNPYA